MEPDDKTFLGDESAFNALYDRYWQSLYQLAARKVRPDIAAEIVQDIFVNLWRKRHELSIQSVDAYLHGAVRWGVLNHFRKEGIAQQYLAHTPEWGSASLADADYSLHLADLQQRVADALQRLPEKTRVVFQLSREEYLSVRDIAAQLALSEKAVEYHITQALRALRTHLADYLPLYLYACAQVW